MHTGKKANKTKPSFFLAYCKKRRKRRKEEKSRSTAQWFYVFNNNKIYNNNAKYIHLKITKCKKNSKVHIYDGTEEQCCWNHFQNIFFPQQLIDKIFDSQLESFLLKHLKQQMTSLLLSYCVTCIITVIVLSVHRPLLVFLKVASCYNPRIVSKPKTTTIR